MVPFDKGRPQDEAHVDELANRGVDGLFRMELPYAMIVMLPSGSYDPSSLTMDPAKVGPIRWTDEAKGLVGVIINGNHRRSALRRLQESRLSVLHEFKSQIALFNEKNLPDKAEELRRKRDAFLEQVRGHFHWEVRVYDLGELDDHMHISTLS